MCACCRSFIQLMPAPPLRQNARLSRVLPAGAEATAAASRRQAPAHLVQHPLHLRVGRDGLTPRVGRGDQPQQGGAFRLAAFGKNFLSDTDSCRRNYTLSRHTLIPLRPA